MIKIYKIFVNAIFVIIIALLLIYLVFRMTDKVEIYRVKTGSMEEKIHVGDYIMIYRKDDYKVGEIVTYTSNDGFITHRIIKKDGNKVVTKGDANNAEDREIVASTIVGKAVLIGGILNFVIDYKYIIICVLISLYLFSCYFGDGKENEEETADNKDSSVSENELAEIKEELDTKETSKEETENTSDIKEKKEEELKETKEEIKDKQDEIKTEEVEEKELEDKQEEKNKNNESEKTNEILESKEEIKKEDTLKDEEILIKKKENK